MSFFCPTMPWLFPSEGPAPSSPVVVSTVPEYFGGRPTPPASPLRSITAVDDYAPCPMTPHVVPSDDECYGPNESEASDSEPTTFTDSSAPTESHENNSSDQDTNSEVPHVSDPLIYSEWYAFPSPVMLMIRRAIMDQKGLHNYPVDLSTFSRPLRLFSLTGGRTPRTGLEDADRQSFEYYAKRPFWFDTRIPERIGSWRYTISAVESIQRELRRHWSLVSPSPIPVMIVRSRDLVGPSTLTPANRRMHCSTFVVPSESEDSIWPTICRRGVDSNFRPLNPFTKVDTTFCFEGSAIYFPQHVVASNFAVNVFVQYSENSNECEYLGAYVLQVLNNLTISSTVWATLDPAVRRSVSGRVRPHIYGRPYIACVEFRYYKWDLPILSLADQCEYFNALLRSASALAHLLAHNNPDDSDSDEDVSSTISAYATGNDHVSFLDLS